MINTLSLFANVGIAETYLSEIGINVLLANEIDPKRVSFYKHLYPNTNIILGDITKTEIKDKIVQEAKNLNIDLIMATPPCQGMSTAGKMDKFDIRNHLIYHALEIIKAIKPKYIFLENVPEQLSTKIIVNDVEILIPDYIKSVLSEEYTINKNQIINAADYGVPQTRYRAIFLLVRKDLKLSWEFPKKEKEIVTLEKAIGHLPSLDPYIKDVNENELLKIFPDFYTKKSKAEKISKWFYPPEHVLRQVICMMHTPPGKSAFDNKDEYKPKKIDGTFVKGFKNTYKRQDWNKPAYTITMYNRTIGSQNNVHPGRLICVDKNGSEIYSDPRVLTIYELLIVTSLPTNWNIPPKTSDHFIRQVIGEGIPPLLVKKIMLELKRAINEKI